MKRKPVIGDVLYRLNVGNVSRYTEQTLVPVIVQSVGKKYFKAGVEGCSEYLLVEYFIDTWRQKTDYTTTWRLYETPEQWEEEKEHIKITDNLRRVFSGGTKVNFTIEQLRRINDIVKEGQI